MPSPRKSLDGGQDSQAAQGEDCQLRPGDQVIYLRTGEKAFICEVHLDDPGEVYYTFKGEAGRERQTTADQLKKATEDEDSDESDESQDAELQDQLALLEEAKLKSQARSQDRSVTGLQDQWNRIQVQQDSHVQAWQSRQPSTAIDRVDRQVTSPAFQALRKETASARAQGVCSLTQVPMGQKALGGMHSRSKSRR